MSVGKRLCCVLLVVVATALVVGGCSNIRMSDTQTIHNRAATRIWIIQNREAGNRRDSVLYCDMEMAQAGRDLCLQWQGR